MDQRPDQVRHSEGAGRKLSGERGEINPNPAATEDELESLRLELAQTRAQMSETVYALQGRLNPQYVREQASSQAKDSARRAGSNLGETIKQNPIPAALTGAGVVGLGWLIASGRDDSQEGQSYDGSRYEDSPHYYGRSSEYPAYYEGENRELESSSYDDEDSGGDRARQAAGDARERASQMGGKLQDRASQAGGQAQEQAQRAKGGFQRMLQENPLAVGALAVGIGAAVGLSIPESEKENQLMGEKRDQLANQGQQKVRDYQDKAQRVAEQARTAAEEEADNQDLKS